MSAINEPLKHIVKPTKAPCVRYALAGEYPAVKKSSPIVSSLCKPKPRKIRIVETK